MEPVGRLYAGAHALPKTEGALAIPVGRFVSARNASRAARFCKRGCPLRGLRSKMESKFRPGVLSFAALLGLLSSGITAAQTLKTMSRTFATKSKCTA